MNCIVTAGPTFEPLDQARRLTNFSTGRLGTELANHLVDQGHTVWLLIGEMATWPGERRARNIVTFSTTTDLRARLQSLAGEAVGAVFHAAAVSDFAFGQVWDRDASGALRPVRAGKLSSRAGALLAELIPTPKLIGSLRAWFPRARLIGWKYEVDGGRDTVVVRAEEQLREHRTDGCVANGPAYGPGFGLVTGPGCHRHLEDSVALFAALTQYASG